MLIFYQLTGWPFWSLTLVFAFCCVVCWSAGFAAFQRQFPVIAQEHRQKDMRQAWSWHIAVMVLCGGPLACVVIFSTVRVWRWGLMWPWSPSPRFDWREWENIETNADL